MRKMGTATRTSNTLWTMEIYPGYRTKKQMV